MQKAFGGPWTELKLDVLKQYLKSYVTALKNQSFRKVYIDSFAGSGAVETKTGKRLDGSAKIALDLNGFDNYVFIEPDRDNRQALETLRHEHTKLTGQIQILSGDANVELPLWLDSLKDINGTRGVAFFDPFGMELKWETLVTVANTGIFDVWYWFPLSGLYRQTPRNRKNITDDKKTIVSKILGTSRWFEDFYKESPQLSLFDENYVRCDVDFLENWVKRRLESIFPAVAPPLRLPRQGAPLFSFFFAVSNPDRKAMGLAMKIAGHILRSANN